MSDTFYKILLRRLPNRLRPALAAERKYFAKYANKAGINLVDDSEAVLAYFSNRGLSVSDMLLSAFPWTDSKAGFKFWLAAYESLIEGTSK